MKAEPIAGTRQPRESPKAVAACNDYLLMGEGRSLAKVLEVYKNNPKTTPKQPQKTPPTTVLKTLKTWSSKYKWGERVEEYTAILAAERDEILREGMREGLALDRERVDLLKSIIIILMGYLDKKKSHDYALVNSIRGVLDDLAKETSGRVKNIKQDGSIDLNLIVREKAAKAIIENSIPFESVVKDVGHRLAIELFAKAGIEVVEE